MEQDSVPVRLVLVGRWVLAWRFLTLRMEAFRPARVRVEVPSVSSEHRPLVMVTPSVEVEPLLLPDSELQDSEHQELSDNHVCGDALFIIYNNVVHLCSVKGLVLIALFFAVINPASGSGAGFGTGVAGPGGVTATGVAISNAQNGGVSASSGTGQAASGLLGQQATGSGTSVAVGK